MSGNVRLCFLVDHLVHKLLTIIARFFISFVKIRVLFKISVYSKENVFCLCLELQINYVCYEQLLKINELPYITLFVVSGYTKKHFSIDVS